MVGGFSKSNHGLGLKIAGRQNIYILEVRCFLDAPKGERIQEIEIFFLSSTKV
jgi:hypothetical protein